MFRSADKVCASLRAQRANEQANRCQHDSERSEAASLSCGDRLRIRLGSRSRFDFGFDSDQRPDSTSDSTQIKGQIRLRFGPDKPLTKTLPPYPPPDFRSEPDQRKDLSRWDFVPHGSGVETLLVCSLRSQTRRFLSRFSLIPPIHSIPPLPQIPTITQMKTQIRTKAF
jgi:hypothetical protein